MAGRTVLWYRCEVLDLGWLHKGMRSLLRTGYFSANRHRQFDHLLGLTCFTALDVESESAPFTGFGCNADFAAL